VWQLLFEFVYQWRGGGFEESGHLVNADFLCWKIQGLGCK